MNWETSFPDHICPLPFNPLSAPPLSSTCALTVKSEMKNREFFTADKETHEFYEWMKLIHNLWQTLLFRFCFK